MAAGGDGTTTGAREAVGGHGPAVGSPLLRAKVQVPPLRGGDLPRVRLLERLVASATPVTLVTAPAGYGKTTLLAQLAARTERVAYLRLDETDADPTVLLADLVDAIETVAALDPGLRQAVATPAAYAAFRGPARMAQALGELPLAVTVILDDLHLVDDRTALDWLAWILDRLPAGWRVVLAARRETGLSLGRMLAAGRLSELGATDLALDAQETGQLAALAGVPLSPDEAGELVARTEGWPLATHLLLRAGTAREPHGTGSDQQVGAAAVTRYLRSELVQGMDVETRDWVLRSAALDELTGPLCDAALETTGSLRMLRGLEATNQLLLPLDVQRTGYRYHALYRELLLTELEVHHPGERARLVRRAAAWLELQGRVVEAVRLVESIGDLDLLASYVERYGMPLFWSGGLATVQEWIARFDRDGFRERYVTVAVQGAWVEAIQGNQAAAMRWLAAAERTVDTRPLFDGSTDATPWISTLRANVMPRGLDRFHADVEAAVAAAPQDSPIMPQLRIALVVREVLAGRLDAADALASDADVHQSMGASPGLLFLLGVRAAVAVGRGDAATARRHVDEALDLAARLHIQDYVTCGLVYAVAARVCAADGRPDEARAMLARVNLMRPIATVVLPWYAVMMRVHAIRAAIALREPATARTLLAEIDDVLRSRPELGVLPREVELVRPIVDALRTPQPGPWTLTAAELRLLAYLPTHLTFREIAERMYLSPHTIKTQAMSIYGKLEVSSRREAIERAVEVSLLDASVLHQAEDAALIA